MKQIFVRRLEVFAQYHRDPYNCATHYIAFPLLFLAVILPLEAFRIDFGQRQLPLGMIMTLPAIMAWISFDLGVGATLLLLICPLFIVAEFVVNQGVAAMWWTAGGLFAVGWVFSDAGPSCFRTAPAGLQGRYSVHVHRTDVRRCELARASVSMDEAPSNVAFMVRDGARAPPRHEGLMTQ